MDQYLCADADRRLEATRADGTLNGIDVVEIDGGHATDVPVQRTLLVRCLLTLPATLSGADVRVMGGVRTDPNINPVRVLWAFPASELAAARAANPRLVSQQDVDVFAALPEPDHLLVVRTNSAGDYSIYRLILIDSDAPRGTLAGG